MGLHVRAVSVFGKKSDAVCGFLAYFCAVLWFSDPPYAPLRSEMLLLPCEWDVSRFSVSRFAHIEKAWFIVNLYHKANEEA